MERGTFRFYLRLMRSTLFKTLIMRFFVWNLRWEENQVTDLGHRRSRKVSFYLGVPHIIYMFFSSSRQFNKWIVMYHISAWLFVIFYYYNIKRET